MIFHEKEGERKIIELVARPGVLRLFQLPPHGLQVHGGLYQIQVVVALLGVDRGSEHEKLLFAFKLLQNVLLC